MVVREWEGGEWGMIANEYGAYSGDDDNVPELDNSDDCTTV